MDPTSRLSKTFDLSRCGLVEVRLFSQLQKTRRNLTQRLYQQPENVLEFMSAPWWSALLAIILIDLVLAGDNAIVIALAARRLPEHLQKKAIYWGAAGAIIVRTLMTIGVVWLLKIPGLMLVGGLGLLYIAYKLLADTGEDKDHGPGATTFWGAMKTIVIADALMGIDNVLGVAGASKGSFDLVIIGLLISVPIVIFGSTLVLKLVERFPIITWLGAAVLAFTAANMIVAEKLLAKYFDPSMGPSNAMYGWIAHILAIALVLGVGWLVTRKKPGIDPVAVAASHDEQAKAGH